MIVVLDPKLFISGSGTVVVMRKDARPLYQVHVEALYGYVDAIAISHGVPALSEDMSFEEGSPLFAKRQERLLRRHRRLDSGRIGALVEREWEA
jgi:hypothetical protein